MPFRPLSVLLAAIVLGACQKKTEGPAPLPTSTAERGDIAVRVQATGVVEPINPVDVKSKYAAGVIIREPIEIGSVVKQGALVAEVDPRDVQNQFNRAQADDVVSAVSLQTSRRDRDRADTLFMRHVITAAQHDSTQTTLTSALSDLISKRASLDLARQALEEATIKAPISGTVVSRPTTQGSVITSAQSANGGTTIASIADLGRVRMRVNIDEVEMGNIRVGLPAGLVVDAFPDRTFDGVIEKIEPQAVVTQGVTFFQVLVSIDNKDGLLLPGMNGELTIRAKDLKDVLQIPIDAVRATTELAPVARLFDIPVDTLTNSLRRDLVSIEGTTGIPGRYVIVALPNGAYEMRLVKIGSTDLRVVQVLDGVKPGDRVVQLGAILISRPAVAPKLEIAADLKRGAPASRAAQAGQTKAVLPSPAAATQLTQAGKAAKP